MNKMVEFIKNSFPIKLLDDSRFLKHLSGALYRTFVSHHCFFQVEEANTYYTKQLQTVTKTSYCLTNSMEKSYLGIF